MATVSAAPGRPGLPRPDHRAIRGRATLSRAPEVTNDVISGMADRSTRRAGSGAGGLACPDRLGLEPKPAGHLQEPALEQTRQLGLLGAHRDRQRV